MYGQFQQFLIKFYLISVPVAFILLPNKKKKAYYKAFKGLKKYCDALGLPVLMAKYCMSDFEANIRTQFLRIWPGIPWHHYLFHFVKAVMRQVS